MDIELPLAARYLLAPINLCFVIGVGIFQMNRRVQVRLGLVLPLAVLGLALVGWQATMVDPNRVIVVAGFAGLVWAAASPHAAKAVPWRPLVALGAASYSVYLVHNPMLSLLARLVPSGMGAGMAYCLIATTALIAGISYWYFYERPMLTVVRRWIGRARQGRAEPA